MIKSAQRKMIRLIVQTKRKYKMKTSEEASADERPEKDDKETKENESHCTTDEETEKGSKASTDCDHKKIKMRKFTEENSRKKIGSNISREAQQRLKNI